MLIQLIAGGSILSASAGMPYWLAVLLIGIVVSLYLFSGGFRAVLRTDVFQHIVILLVVVLSSTIFGKMDGLDPSSFGLFTAGPVNVLGFFLYGVLVIVIAAEFWQRIFAGRSVRVVRKSLVLSSIIFLVLSFFIVFIGLAVRANVPGIPPETAILVGLTQLLPPALLGMGAVVLFAAVMSSFDTFVFVLSTSLVNDFMKSSRSEGITLQRVRWISVVLGLLGVLFALVFKSVISVLISISGLYFSLSPSLIASFIWRLDGRTVILSMLLGLAGSITGFSLMGLSIASALASIPFSILGLLIGRLLWRGSRT